MGWEVTVGEAGGVLTGVEQTLARAMRRAEARLEGIGACAGLVRALRAGAEVECPECGDRFPDASAEGWEKSEGRCKVCSKADHNDYEDYDPEEY